MRAHMTFFFAIILLCSKNFHIIHFAQSLCTMIRIQRIRNLFVKTSMEILSYDRSCNKTGRK